MKIVRCSTSNGTLMAKTNEADPEHITVVDDDWNPEMMR